MPATNDTTVIKPPTPKGVDKSIISRSFGENKNFLQRRIDMSASLNKGIYFIKQFNDETIEKIIHITEPLLQDPKNRRKRKMTKKQNKIINFPTLYSCEK